MENYQLGKLIESDTFSCIHKATKISGGETILIKKIDTEKLNLKLFMKEIDGLQNLHHPSIAQYFERFKQNQYDYILMEFCPWETLKKFISDQTTSFRREIYFKTVESNY
jgi:serine/threonine protein kinase